MREREGKAGEKNVRERDATSDKKIDEEGKKVSNLLYESTVRNYAG